MINVRDTQYIILFGKHLKSIRKSKGLSQEQLELRSNISKNQIGNIERGEINPTLSTLYAIAKALEIELKVLLDF